VARAAAADLIALLFGGKGGNLAGVFGTLLDSFGLPGRAGGGAVSAGGAYLVGEQGPEVLVMGGRPGAVVPNAMLSTGGGGFAPVTHVHIDARTDAAQVAQVAGQAVRTAQEGMWQQLRARGLA
jgi:phage-related minor tail protein